MLLNITGPADVGLFEVNEAAEVVTGHADPNANVIFGAVIDESLGDEVRVTVIATGFGGRPRRRRLEAAGVASVVRERRPRFEAPATVRDRDPELPPGELVPSREAGIRGSGFPPLDPPCPAARDAAADP